MSSRTNKSGKNTAVKICGAICKNGTACNRKCKTEHCWKHLSKVEKNKTDENEIKNRAINDKVESNKTEENNVPMSIDSKCPIEGCSNIVSCCSDHHEENNGDHKIQSENPIECVICLEDISNNQPLKCGHYIHYQCVLKSLKPECPVCREKVVVPNDIEKDMNDRMRTFVNNYDVEMNENFLRGGGDINFVPLIQFINYPSLQQLLQPLELAFELAHNGIDLETAIMMNSIYDNDLEH